MQSIGAGDLGNTDDVLDIEIGFDRPLAFADPIGLVRFEAVQ